MAIPLPLPPECHQFLDYLFYAVGKENVEVLVFPLINQIFKQLEDRHLLCPEIRVHEYHRTAIAKTEIMVLHRILKNLLHCACAAWCIYDTTHGNGQDLVFTY